MQLLFYRITEIVIKLYSNILNSIKNLNYVYTEVPKLWPVE